MNTRAFVEISAMGSCVLNCKYCPQDLLRSRYNGNKIMSFEEFKMIESKIPKNSTISFAGFSEPSSNPYIVDMIKHSFSQGHEVMLLTTLIGMDIKKYNDIKDYTYGHFSIHLPDDNMKTSSTITDSYLELLKYVINNPPNGVFLCNHHSGQLDDRIRNLVPHSYLLDIHDRSGNLEYDDGNVRHTYKNGNIKCGHRFLDGNSGLVLPNLDVVLCCSDFGLENIMGNLNVQSWEDIASGVVYKNVCHNNTDGLNSICRKCELAIQY